MSEKKDITVEAEFEVISSSGSEIVRTFARAWGRSLELPTPVHGQFTQWVRKDEKKK